ncbi:MAG TPA: hypothetical protein VOA87_06145, partial [Thermoanaerobaculia bacterium]|nr:hypothetical protein [Thermoanaerobaculia bacterium]
MEQTENGGARRRLDRSAFAAALVSFAAALAVAFVLAGVTHPPSIFPKYLAAAAAPAAEQAERLLDYSPLYLGLTRAVGALAPGYRPLLVLHGFLHAGTAGAVALAAALLAGPGWGLLAGLGVASYRPFLVYCGIHEPETLILFCLALAILMGLLARERLQPGFAVLAFAALAAAGLARPQHLLLAPVWALWIASGARSEGGENRRSARRWAWGTCLVVTAAVVGPLAVARSLAAGFPTLMNPGAVFYEGNGPGATGLARFAPPAVIELERAHREAFDYGHVAYRRIAAAATSRPLPALRPPAANRYWSGLALEAMAAWPLQAARRFGRKAAMSLMPYEGHDLVNAEQLERRLRPRLPWGFALLLLALPWVPLACRERLRELAGPLAVALLAAAVQVGLYASARQRLPLALALWVAGPVLAADLAGGRLRVGLRPLGGLLLGVLAALCLAQATARTALLDQLGWDELLGTAPPSWGASLAAIEDGRALRPALAESALCFRAGLALARQGRPADALRALAPLVGTGSDFTVDDKDVGVPEYQAALDLLVLGDRERARQAALAAERLRPDDPRVAAL